MFDEPVIVTTGDVRIAVAGALGEMSLPQLRSALEHFLDDLPDGRRRVIDLTGVTFLPSGAVGVVVYAVRSYRRTGGEITVVCPRTSVAGRVLQMLGFPFDEGPTPVP